MWSSRVRRVLIFSYKFSFRWFHNDVLSFIRKNSFENAEIDVLATRFDDETYAGASRDFSADLYSLDEWGKWKGRLKVRYLPSHSHLFHNKFILVESAHGKELALGLGSSNLTASGWLRNFETWNWNSSASLSPCADFLQYLSRFKDFDSGLLLSWVRVIHKLRPRSANVSWLFGDKIKPRKTAFRALTRGQIGKPAILRIVSPYFDEQSPALFEELFEDIRLTAGQPRRVELWIDGSARVARRSDYNAVLQLFRMPMQPKIEIKTIKRSAQANEPNFRVPLHAKIIELEGTTGTVNRILGSANFTGAAWLSKRNTETIFLESGQRNLPTLLPQGYDSLCLTKSAIRDLMRTAIEDDTQTVGQNRWIYWASYDEQRNPPTLTVSYESKDRPIQFQLRGHFDSRHKDLSSEKAKSIIKAFTDPKHWGKPQIEQSVFRVRCQRRDLQFPEYVTVFLVFSDGLKIDAPVEATNPDFSNARDSATGIPFEPSLETLLGGRKTIVKPISKKSTIEATEGDEAIEDEEEVTEAPWAAESLSEDPDFDRQPLAVRFAKLLADSRKRPALANQLRERLIRFAAQIENPAERMLARSVLKALENKPT